MKKLLLCFVTISAFAAIAVFIQQAKIVSKVNTVATVGNFPILSSDVDEYVDKIIEQNKDKIPPDAPPSFIEDQKKILMKSILDQMIETKIVYADAMQNVPAENVTKMRTSVNKEFQSTIVKKMMQKHNLNSRAELEEKLLKSGSSLEKEEQKFFERSLASMWMKQQVKVLEIPPATDIANRKLIDEEQQKLEEAFLAKVRERVKVCTAYDGEPVKQ